MTGDATVHPVTATAVVKAQISASAAVRNYLASQHLWTAQHNAELCRRRELDILGKRPIDIQHRSYAMTAIMMSVAFLESLVNEVFEDAGDPASSARVAAIEDHKELLASFWASVSNGRFQLLGKFQMALLLCGAEQFDKGTQPFQDAQLLIQLGNALVHFTPEWHGSKPEEKFQRKLAERIKPSGLLNPDDGSDWVSVKALGAPGAEWAVLTANTFADDWSTRLGIPMTYEADLANWEKTLNEDGA